MTSPATAPPLAVSSGVAVVDRGGALWVVDLRTGWVATAVFVAGLCAAIGLLGGVAILVKVGWAGLIPLAFGGLGVGALVALVRWKRKREAAPLASQTVLCVMDPTQGVVTDAAGQPFAHLQQVRLERAFQLTSSSPALELRYPAGKLVLVRGNPFGGGIHDVEHVLRERLQR